MKIWCNIEQGRIFYRIPPLQIQWHCVPSRMWRRVSKCIGTNVAEERAAFIFSPTLRGLPWRWKQQTPSKRNWLCTIIHGILFQKFELFLSTAMVVSHIEWCVPILHGVLYEAVRAHRPGRPVRFAAHRQPLCWNSCTIHELFCLYVVLCGTWSETSVAQSQLTQFWQIPRHRTFSYSLWTPFFFTTTL